MRLIDADKIFRRVKESTASKGVKCLAEVLVATAPTVDAVVVTRCKDCEKSGVTEFGKRYCKEPMGCFCGCIPVEDDYFCSGGRRKDGAE